MFGQNKERYIDLATPVVKEAIDAYKVIFEALGVPKSPAEIFGLAEACLTVKYGIQNPDAAKAATLAILASHLPDRSVEELLAF